MYFSFSFCLFYSKIQIHLERSDAVAIAVIVVVTTLVTDQLADGGEVLRAALLAHVRAGEAGDVVRRAHHAEGVGRRDGRRVGREGGRVRCFGPRGREGGSCGWLVDIDAPRNARTKWSNACVCRCTEARD